MRSYQEPKRRSLSNRLPARHSFFERLTLSRRFLSHRRLLLLLFLSIRDVFSSGVRPGCISLAFIFPVPEGLSKLESFSLLLVRRLSNYSPDLKKKIIITPGTNNPRIDMMKSMPSVRKKSARCFSLDTKIQQDNRRFV